MSAYKQSFPKIKLTFDMAKLSLELQLRLNAHKATIKDKDRELRSPSETHTEGGDNTSLNVVLEHHGDIKNLEAFGFKVRTQAGSIVYGSIAFDKLTELAAHEQVIRIEEPSKPRLCLDKSIPDIKANIVRGRSGDAWTGITGSNIIVGIIDTGIDFRHGTFRKADGTTRILKIWDQTLTAVSGEHTPTNIPASHPLGAVTLNYGVEYTETQINMALNNAFNVRHKDKEGHGTHVAGIAAGNGSQNGNCSGAFTFSGVAPEANIIIVRMRGLSDGDPDPISTANHFIEALRYFENEARADAAATPPRPRRPMVVNMSLGSWWGSRDGTHPDAVSIDNIANANANGFIMVKSAGNEANKRRHVHGSVPRQAVCFQSK
jgi:subtilisin family serine protease